MHRHEFVFYPTNSHHECNLKGSNNSYTFSTLIHIKYYRNTNFLPIKFRHVLFYSLKERIK